MLLSKSPSTTSDATRSNFCGRRVVDGYFDSQLRLWAVGSVDFRTECVSPWTSQQGGMRSAHSWRILEGRCQERRLHAIEKPTNNHFPPPCRCPKQLPAFLNKKDVYRPGFREAGNNNKKECVKIFSREVLREISHDPQTLTLVPDSACFPSLASAPACDPTRTFDPLVLNHDDSADYHPDYKAIRTMNDYGKAVMHGMSGLHKAVRECYPSRKLDHARYIGTGERYDRSRAHYNNHTSPCRNAPLTSSCCPQCWAPPNQSRSKELCREASPTPSHCKQCWYHPTQSHWKQCRLPKPCSKELCREASLTPSHCKQCWYHPTQSHWKQCRCRLTPPRPPGSNILSLLQSNLQQCWVTGPWLLQHLSKTQQQSTSRHTLVTGPPTRWLSWLDDHVILCSAMSAALLLISVSWVDQKVIRILYLPLGRTNTAPTWPTLPCDILTRAYATLIEILADQIVLRSISAHFGVYMRPSVGPQVVTEGTTPQYHTTIIAGNLTLLRDTRIWWLLWIIPTWLHWMAF